MSEAFFSVLLDLICAPFRSVAPAFDSAPDAKKSPSLDTVKLNHPTNARRPDFFAVGTCIRKARTVNMTSFRRSYWCIFLSFNKK